LKLKPAINKPSEELALILGPCSAESPDQLEEVVTSTLSMKPDLIRAGVWKPRTRPGHFQGIGAPALDWMANLSRKYGCRFCTEVATAEHVELCLKSGITDFWIGARTTVNPFYVQDIADAIKGQNVRVMIKNPINPDLFLWLGAIERIYQSGIEHISAIHRGFSFYGNSVYRNIPRWQIPIEIKRRYPDLQLLADVSHISGRPEHLLEIAQIALDLNFNGFMAEIHPDPSNALSDADQQVTASFFEEQVLRKLVYRHEKSTDELYNNKIAQIREHIDHIDHELVRLLGERMRLAESIGKEKKSALISIFQPDRWNEIIGRLRHKANENGLSEEFIFSLIEAIHIESIQHQSREMNK